jgi:rhamnosyltransferase
MNSLCAIVITFNPDSDFGGRMDALEREVDWVVIVDNASKPAHWSELIRLEKPSKIKLIRNPDNFGIATALNQGVEYALGLGAKWIATFDQDSLVTPGFFDAMFAAYRRFPERSKVAVMSPLLRDPVLGIIHTFTYGRGWDRGDSAVVRTSITSGNLIPAGVFAAVGKYREDFFIDYVDHEFCLRCRRHGWVILEVRAAVLVHNYGEPARRRFLWKQPVITNHSPVRRYYQARNRLVVHREIGLFDLSWQSRDWYEFGRDLVKIVFLEEQSWLKVRAVFRGLFHGIVGRMGRMS